MGLATFFFQGGKFPTRLARRGKPIAGRWGKSSSAFSCRAARDVDGLNAFTNAARVKRKMRFPIRRMTGKSCASTSDIQNDKFPIFAKEA